LRCRKYRVADQAGRAGGGGFATGAREFRHAQEGYFYVPMNEAPENRDEGPADDEELVEEEAEAAAAEAAEIGGDVPADSDDPAMQPLAEAGEGESEGFELAEKDLEDIASHGDQHRFPDNVPPPPEEAENAERGEADQEIPPDGPE
jgi:hypothetical protein